MAAFVLRMNESTPAVVRFSNITQTRIRAWPARPEICLYNDSSPNLRRRDGRVAEGARLESVFRGNSNVGSNPTLSAIFTSAFIVGRGPSPSAQDFASRLRRRENGSSSNPTLSAISPQRSWLVEVLRLRLRISPRGSDAAKTAQVRIPLSPPAPQRSLLEEVLRLRLRISPRGSDAAKTAQVRIPLSPPFKHSAVSNQPKQTPRRFLCAEAKPRLKSVSNQRCIVGIGTSWRRRVLVWPALLAILLFVPGSASAQVDASSGQSGSSNKQSQSLGDSLRHGGRKQLHIFYLHGIGSDGPGDHDSLALREGICRFVRDCIVFAGERDGTEYADQDRFKLNAPPPPLRYLDQDVWRKDHGSAPERANPARSGDPTANTSEEWNAAAPFVVHWKLARSAGQTIYVDEINWWPLVFSLKCRQIVESDAELVGPSADRIKLCARR